MARSRGHASRGGSGPSTRGAITTQSSGLKPAAIRYKKKETHVQPPKNVHFKQTKRTPPRVDSAQQSVKGQSSNSDAQSPGKSEGPPPLKAVQQTEQPSQGQQRDRSSRRAAPTTQQSTKTAVPTPQELAEAFQDRAVMAKLKELRDAITLFSENYFDFSVKGTIEKVMATAPTELISYVGCIAIGGPSGREGWWQLMENPQLRKALVFGIINRVMQEHVIASLCFGADEGLINKLVDMEKAQVDKDGFYRAEQRANLINAWPGDYLKSTDICINRLTLQLAELLQPILELDYLHIDRLQADAGSLKYMYKLRIIITIAQQLNLLVRLNGSVVYYFEPVFKDDEFDPHSMTCFNVRDMQNTCPLPGFDDNGNDTTPRDPRGDDTDKALVRVVCSQGCVAYRKGGGDLGKRLLAEDKGKPDYSQPPELRAKRPRNEVYGRVITEKDGFRSKTIAKSVVALRWGKPQFTEKPEFRENYVELVDVQRELGGETACSVM